jgi:hypothetical protein
MINSEHIVGTPCFNQISDGLYLDAQPKVPATGEVVG